MGRPIADAARASAADLPSLDRLLNDAAFSAALAQHGRTRTTSVLRAELAAMRESALAGELDAARLAPATIGASVAQTLERASQPSLRPVFNLTGTVLHTNLGRAVLPDEAVRAVVAAITAPVNLEFDLDTGTRGDRDTHVEALICELTGAEAATIVNNNAAAVLLVLNTLANRRDAIVSRGELIEIGGSFRIPDIMQRAGAKLVEVGTTNRTHLDDFAGAIGVRTGLMMKVHTSNYEISGFVKSLGVDELAKLARERSVPLVVDLGSGNLVDLSKWNLPREPTVRDTIEAGADLVAFSADKLLGGPQAGIVAGRADLIAKLKKNPLKRALRVGKLTLAALEPVLALYRSPERLAERLTTLRLLTRPTSAMQAQAERLLVALGGSLGEGYDIVAEPTTSQIGSGALPVDRLPSFGLAIRIVKGKRGSLDRLERALRALPRPAIGRIADKTLWLDLRCLDEADEATFVAQWRTLRP